ncbi:MAG: leucine-rich repeat protein [Lachnospiraceae bacterium]|nr:leucine-rich repeat protein [Lachnospiraceae bacterium]
MENNSKVVIEKPVKSGDTVYTCTVKNISADINLVVNGKAVATTTPDPTAAPALDRTVTVTKTNVDENITLTVNKTTINKATQELTVKNGVTVPVEIAPAENYIWDTDPEVKVDGTVKALDKSSTTYKTSVVISKNTTIAVSGGSVISVSNVTDNMPSAEPAEGNMENSSITIPNEVKNSIVNTIIDKLLEANAGMTKGAIIAELEKSEANITTNYKVSEATTPEAITEAKTSVKSKFSSLSEALSTILGEDANEETFKTALDDGYVVDIDINVTYTFKGTSMTTTISVLGDEVTVSMPVPTNLKDKDTSKGSYVVFRIHDGEVTVIPCKLENGKLIFTSDKFSKYVISFVEKETKTPTPSPTGGNNSGSIGGIGGGYIPSTSATPAPSATAAPSASPSADPSASPSVDATASPSESGAPSTGDNTTEPTKAPAATDKPADDDKNTGSTTVKVGKKATVSGSQYKVTAVKGTRTVQFTKGKKNAKSVVVPSTVKISGKNYKVTTIAKNAFKGNKKLAKVTIGKNVNKIGVSAFQNCSKLKSIIIKSTKLTAKKVGKNAFKGINKKATFKVPKSKVKAYKKIVKAKGAGKNVKVKK